MAEETAGAESEVARQYGYIAVERTGTSPAIFRDCPDCAAVCMDGSLTKHDEFHEQFEAVQQLIIVHNQSLNDLDRRLKDEASKMRSATDPRLFGGGHY